MRGSGRGARVQTRDRTGHVTGSARSAALRRAPLRPVCSPSLIKRQRTGAGRQVDPGDPSVRTHPPSSHGVPEGAHPEPAEKDLDAVQERPSRDAHLPEEGVHDQLPHADRHRGLAGQGQDLHLQEADPVPQLDRRAHQRVQRRAVPAGVCEDLQVLRVLPPGQRGGPEDPKAVRAGGPEGRAGVPQRGGRAGGGLRCHQHHQGAPGHHRDVCRAEWLQGVLRGVRLRGPRRHRRQYSAGEAEQPGLHRLQHGGGRGGLHEEDQVLRELVPDAGRGSGQGAVLHKDHGRGAAVPGEPGPGPHPEPHRVLPHEHPHHPSLHLPVPAWRKRAQRQGAHWGRLGALAAGQAVRQVLGQVHPGPEHQGPEGVDQPDEADHPDGRGAGGALRAVEGAQRDRRGRVRGDDVRGDTGTLPPGVRPARPGQVQIPLPQGRVLRGPGPAAGAGHHGAGAAGERAGHLPPGCHALPAGLLPGQVRRRAALPEVPPAHRSEAHARGIRLPSGVHFPER